MPTHPAEGGELRAECVALLRLGPPLMLASLGTTLMGSVDVWMVSPLGKTAIGAVALGSSYAATVTFVTMGLLAPIDALVAQAVGAGDRSRAGSVLRAGLKLALAAAIPAALLLLFPGPAIRALVGRSGSGEDLVALASGYCRPLAFSLPGFLVYAAMRDFVLGHSRPMPELAIVAAANAVNLAGNWALIGGHWGFPALGTAGCAWSTAIAQSAMFVAMALFLRADPKLRESARAGAAAGSAKEIARLGLPLGAIEGLRIGFLAVIAGMMERLGRDALAGNQIALSIGLLAHTVPLGLGWAVGIRVATRSAVDRRGTRKTLAVGLTLGALFALATACVYLAAGGWIARRYSADPEVIAETVRILRSWALLQVALAAASIAGNALVGLLDMRFVAAANLVALYLIALPVGWLLGIALSLGPATIWAGPVLAQAGLAAVLAWRFRGLSAAPASASGSHSGVPSGVQQG